MITAEELGDELRVSKDLRPLVEAHVLNEEIPYVFGENPDAYGQLTSHLTEHLGVDSANIRIIGSAKTGFSLSPEAFPRPFGAESDVDVLVVDEGLFDLAWETMLIWNYPRRMKLRGSDLYWSRDRQADLYWGWFVPDKIRYEGLQFPRALTPMRDLSSRWFDAFQDLSSQPALARREVHGRLYRSWNHAFLYHVDSLRRVQETLTKGVIGGLQDR